MTSTLTDRCRDFSGLAPEADVDAGAMIGLFQRFRPDGRGLKGLYDGLAHDESLHDRLTQLFEAAGDDGKNGGGRDAYFIVRKPPVLDADVAQDHGQHWLKSIKQMAERVGNTALAESLQTLPRIRVLEGMPPKQPKSDRQTFPLLAALKDDAATLTDNVACDNEVVSLMREAYYFTACDWALRDYLLWPTYAEAFGQSDAMSGYFELWRHGVKWRVFHDDMIDLYLPR